MKRLFILTIALCVSVTPLLLTSCSGIYNLTKPETFEIVIEEQSNINTMSFVVEVETETIQ